MNIAAIIMTTTAKNARANDMLLMMTVLKPSFLLGLRIANAPFFFEKQKGLQ